MAGIQEESLSDQEDLASEGLVDGGSPRSTASQDVGGLSPASSGELNEEAKLDLSQLRHRTKSLVSLPEPAI